jgi:hypothetical protein
MGPVRCTPEGLCACAAGQVSYGPRLLCLAMIAAVDAGLDPTAALQPRSTTLHPDSYQIQSLLFESDNRVSP